MCLGSYLRGCLDQLVSLLPAAVSCKMEGSLGRAKESLKGPLERRFWKSRPGGGKIFFLFLHWFSEVIYFQRSGFEG